MPMANSTNARSPSGSDLTDEEPDDGSQELEAKVERKHWWEKTVEYWFVRHVMPEVSDAFPMAHHPEASFGDLLLRDGRKFRLIEFKATRAGFGLEKLKYPALLQRKVGDAPPKPKPGTFEALLLEHHGRIAGHDKRTAHVFVFGMLESSGFVLKSRVYADRDAEKLPLRNQADVDGLGSMTGDEMYAYMMELDKARGGRVGSGSFVLVGLEGGQSLLLTAQEFGSGFRLGLDAKAAKAAKAAKDATAALKEAEDLAATKVVANLMKARMKATSPNTAASKTPPGGSHSNK